MIAKHRGLRPYRYALAGFWTVVVLGLFLADVVRTQNETRSVAEEAARRSFNKDLAFRLWVSSHGGVYVSAQDNGTPSPADGAIPGTKAQIPSENNLTLTVPHQVINQVQRSFSDLYEIKSHLTSLSPSGPETAPDEWERRALTRLAAGETEVIEFVDVDGSPSLRLMKPLVTAKACLTCHAREGHKEGQVYGGVGIVMPMRALKDWEHRQIVWSVLSYGIIHVLGLVGIVLGMKRLERREEEREQTAEALKNANLELEGRVEQRTAELRESNSILRSEMFQREKAQEEQLLSETRYRRLVESAPLGILSIDNTGQVTEANPALLHILDPSEESHRGPVNLLSLPFVVEAGIAEDFESCLRSAEPVISERTFFTGSGRRVAVRLHLAPLRDGQDHIVGAQAVVDDITDRFRAREELRESEKRFRSLFESATEFIHILDVNGSIVQTNPAALMGLGYRMKHLAGRCISDFMSEKSKADFPAAFETLVTKGYHRHEVEFVKSDGSILTLDCSYSAIRDEQGDILSFVLFQRDITDHKRAEEKIEQQNEFLHAVLESLTHPFYVVDAETYEVVLANTAAGLSFVPGGSTCFALSHGRMSPCDSPDEPCPVQEVKRTKASAMTQHVHRDREGNPRTFEVHAYPLFDSHGNVVQIIEYSLDITERTRAEQALKESEERMRLVIESSPVGIVIAQQGRYRYVNPAFVRMLGYESSEQIVGRPMSTLCVSDDRMILDRSTREVLEGRNICQCSEIGALRHDETVFEAMLWLTAIEHQQEPAVLGFVTDVSQERKLRSQLLQAQKMDAIGTLAAGIAHDFNNLIQAIHGYAELALLKTRRDESGYSEFQVILSAARRAGELTTGLLTFSRQVHGKQRPVNLNREIQEVTKLLGRTIPKLIQTELHLAQDLAIVNADPAQLQQVIMNLAVNARDAMPDGGKLIMETNNIILDQQYSKTHPGTRPGPHVMLTVSDTGCGMRKETLDRIFEPFFSTKEHSRGTGLGLSIVYGIIKAHDGHITCYSEPGVGTTIKTYLPAVEVAADAIRPEVAESIRGGDETILLVDDEAPLLNLGREILSRFGYSVLTAADGAEALEVFRRAQGRIALVILDLMMPEISGWECLEEMLIMDPGARIIIASGYAANGQMEDALAQGATGFVRKPYEVKVLLDLVRSVLDAE